MPKVAVSPFTLTQPLSIQASASRREAIPNSLIRLDSLVRTSVILFRLMHEPIDLELHSTHRPWVASQSKYGLRRPDPTHAGAHRAHACNR